MTRPRSPIVLSQSEAIAPKSSSASDARGVLSRWLAPRAPELSATAARQRVPPMSSARTAPAATRRSAAAVLRRDEVEDDRAPSEVACALAFAGPRVEELTHAAPLDHPDRPLGELACDVAPAMRAETPVEVPVDDHPCRSAPTRIARDANSSPSRSGAPAIAQSFARHRKPSP